MKKYLTIFILTFLVVPYIYGQTTFDIQLVAVVNDGTNFGVAVQVKGNNLPLAKTINSTTIDVTFDNSILTYSNATNWAFQLGDGYSRFANNNGTKITITVTGSGVGPSGGAGYDVTSSYQTWVQLNFTHSSPSSTTNMDIDPSSVAISLFLTEGNSDDSGDNQSYTSSSINLHGLTDQPLPVELSSFSADVNSNNVNLNWKTATEVNNNGFEVQRKTDLQNSSWTKIGFLQGHGNSNSPKNYSFTDENLTGGTKYIYRLKQIDNDGKFNYSKEIEVKVVPAKYELNQNYPNPFNPNTEIKYNLPKASRVVLNVYNIIGQQVASLINGEVEAGYHSVTFNGSNLPSGTYIYRLQTPNFVQTKKMILLK